MPATLTQFNADLTIDHALMAEHGKWLIDSGCTAIIEKALATVPEL